MKVERKAIAISHRHRHRRALPLNPSTPQPTMQDINTPNNLPPEGQQPAETHNEAEHKSSLFKMFFDNAQKLGDNTEKGPLSNEFFRHYGQRLFVVLILVTFYINLRFNCEKSMYVIDELKRELNDARYTSIAKWGELTRKNKPETVRKRVEESSVSLLPGDEPPVLLD